MTLGLEALSLGALVLATFVLAEVVVRVLETDVELVRGGAVSLVAVARVAAAGAGTAAAMLAP